MSATDARLEQPWKGPAMEHLSAALDSARSLTALLDAAWDAFEFIIAMSGDHADTDEGFSAALVYALAAAANGRDAIITAPSLSPRLSKADAARVDRGHWGANAAEVESSLAALSDVLAGRLELVASTASDSRDQAACRIGARYAREIHGLLAGTQP